MLDRSHSPAAHVQRTAAPAGHEDLGERVRRAQQVPPTPDDRTILAGSGGRPATAEELRAFVAREQQRIARERAAGQDRGR